MRKFLVRAIPIATIILFVLVMQSDVLYKKYFDDNNITNSINSILSDIIEDKWAEADAKTKQLKESWKKVTKIIQFSAERDEIKLIDKNMSRLQGALMAKDKSSAVIELHEALEHWKNINE